MRKILSIVITKDELAKILASACDAPIDENSYVKIDERGNLEVSIDYQEEAII